MAEERYVSRHRQDGVIHATTVRHVGGSLQNQAISKDLMTYKLVAEALN